MDFFAQQDEARRASRWLVLWYLVAAAFVILCFNFAGALGYAVIAIFGLLPLAGGEAVVWQGLARTYWHALVNVPPAFHLWVTGIVGSIVAGVSAWRVWKLSEGGTAVAQMLGARYLERGRANASESRLLNVVEEIAIASGISVPPVYLLAYDDAVNALVAGHSPNEAVIIVTRGLVQKLTRDELQGVMGHEFSHILNGDMALNVRLAGLLGGLTVFGEIGEALVYGAAETARGKSRENVGGEVFGAIFGALIAFVAFPGSFAAEAIKAAISRRRELLADAASVQFTRNPDGIAGALDAVSPLIELALPALKQLKQKERDAFLAEVTRVVEADRKVTLAEFVQATLLRQHLREGAGKPIPTRFRKVEEVAQDAHLVLSLIAHASRGDTEAAHAKGKAVLGIELPGPVPVAELSGARLGEALERLRHLQPFQKPRVLKACVEAAAADGVFRLAEAELVRAVAATLDCPLPPVIGALDPATLAA